MNNFNLFKQNTNILFVVDHAGRAGNAFFQTIFDSHPQVLACPWMHYVYSYIIESFGNNEFLDSNYVHSIWKDTTYFTLLYNDLGQHQSQFIYKIGGDPEALLDRALVRATFDEIILSKDVIHRKDLIHAIFYSFALGRGIDTTSIRYVLCPDSISLKSESVANGYSGRIIDIVIQDFPKARIVHLERDPRAGFASSTHQFINQLGNMYGVKPSNFVQRYLRLLRCDIDWDSVFVFGFWLLYFKQTYDTIMLKRTQYPQYFMTVRNEDLNLNFVNTMSTIASSLNIDFLEIWSPHFSPTMLGITWMSTGAYNNRYQTFRNGPLKNDPNKISHTVSGPNEYVTSRWKKRLKPREINILEILFSEEIDNFGYDYIFPRHSSYTRLRLIILLLQPLSGELPSPSWIFSGLQTSLSEFLSRIFFVFVSPLFYVQSRISLFRIIFKGSLFGFN